MSNYWIFRVYPNRIIEGTTLYGKFSVEMLGSKFPSFEEAIQYLVIEKGFPTPTHFNAPRFTLIPDENDRQNAVMDQFGWYVLCSDSQERWYHFVIVDHDLEKRNGVTHPLIKIFSQHD